MSQDTKLRHERKLAQGFVQDKDDLATRSIEINETGHFSQSFSLLTCSPSSIRCSIMHLKTPFGKVPYAIILS